MLGEDLAGRTSTNELLNECERVKRAAIDDADLAQQQRQARSLRSWKDELGMLRFAGSLEPLTGVKLLAELERQADRLFRDQSRAKGPIDTVEQRMADALASLVGESGAASKREAGRAPWCGSSSRRTRRNAAT